MMQFNMWSTYVTCVLLFLTQTTTTENLEKHGIHVKSNIFISELRHVNLGPHQDSTILYIQIGRLVSMCIMSHLKMLLQTTFKEHFMCTKDLLRCDNHTTNIYGKHSSSVLRNTHPMGCFNIIHPWILFNTSSKMLQFDHHQVILKITVEKGHLVNVTFTELNLPYSNKKCTFYSITFRSLFTHRGPLEGSLCKTMYFTGEGLSFISSENMVTIEINGWFTSEARISVTYSSTLSPKSIIVVPMYWTRAQEMLLSFYQPYTLIIFFNSDIGGKALLQYTDKHSLTQVFEGPGLRSPRKTPNIISDTEVKYILTYSPALTLLFRSTTNIQWLRESVHSVIFTYSKVKVQFVTADHPLCSTTMLKKKMYIRITANTIPENIGSIHCIWMFPLKSFQALKVLISQWRYKGPSDSNCYFGGIAIFSVTEDLSNLVSTRLCGKIVHESTGIMNVSLGSYTKNVLVRFSQYAHYSRGHFVVDLSHNQCLVHSNICLLRRELYLGLEGRRWKYPYKCVTLQLMKENQSYNETGYRQVTCRLTATSIYLDAELFFYNIQCFPFSSNASVFVKGKLKCDLSYLLLVDEKFVSILSNRFSETFRKIFRLDINLNTNSGQQLLAVINISNMSDPYLPYVPAGTTTSLTDIWPPPYMHTFRMVSSTAVYYQRTSITLEHQSDNAYGYFYQQIVFIVGYSEPCSTKCTNDSLFLTMIRRNRPEYIVETTIMFTITIRVKEKPTVLPLVPHLRSRYQVDIIVHVNRTENNHFGCQSNHEKCRLIFTIQYLRAHTYKPCPHYFNTEPFAGEKVYSSFISTKCYSVVFPNHLFTWFEARHACRKRGGDLAKIDIANTFDENTTFAEFKISLWPKLVKYWGVQYLSSISTLIGVTETERGLRWKDNSPISNNFGSVPPPETPIMKNILNNQLRTSNNYTPLCGAISSLLPRNPSYLYSFPCNTSFQNAAYMCEYERGIQNRTQYKHGPISKYYNGRTRCRDGGLYMFSSCVYLMICNISNSKHICRSQGMSTYIIQKESEIALYLYTYKAIRSPCLAGHWRKNGQIRMFEPSYFLDKDRDMPEFLLDKHLYFHYYGDRQICRSSLRIYCKLDPIQASNHSSNTLVQCKSGEYIWEEGVCDGTIDCTSGEDEVNCWPGCKFAKNDSKPESCEDCKSDTCICNVIFFQCRNGGCIRMGGVCDQKKDCADGSDEMDCVYPQCHMNTFPCSDGLCISVNAVCDGVPDCYKGQDEINCLHSEICDGHQCETGECIGFAKLNNFVIDCFSGEDEVEYVNLIKTQWFQSNLSFHYPPMMLPCYPGHSKLFPINESCIYDTEADYTLTTCGNGGHLKFCGGMDCSPTTFKCHMSYCIPWRKLCDGVRDCPNGEDEDSCPLKMCPSGLFKCKGEVRCLVFDEVCDGVIHCTLVGDDESICPHFDCPEMCKCTFNTVFCNSTNPQHVISFFKRRHFLFNWRLDIHVISMTSSNLTSSQFFELAILVPFMRYLSFSYNHISLGGKSNSMHLPFLYKLDLSYNTISYIPDWFLSKFPNVKILNFSHNHIHEIYLNTFTSQNNLHYLDLSFNQVKDITLEYTQNMFTIGVFNIAFNVIVIIPVDFIVSTIKIGMLITEKGVTCCNLESVLKCVILRSGEVDCSDILKGTDVKLLYWSLGCAICTSCVSAIFLLIQGQSSQLNSFKTSVFVQQNILLADFLQGINILSTAIADHVYRRSFQYVREQWADGSLCFLLYLFSVLGTIQSQFLTAILGIFNIKGITSLVKQSISWKKNALIFSTWLLWGLLIVSLNHFINKEEVLAMSRKGICNWLANYNIRMSKGLTKLIPFALIIITILLSHVMSICFNIIIVWVIIKTKKISKRSRYTQNEKFIFIWNILTPGLRGIYMGLALLLISVSDIWKKHYSKYFLFVASYSFLNAVLFICQLLKQRFTLSKVFQ